MVNFGQLSAFDANEYHRVGSVHSLEMDDADVDSVSTVPLRRDKMQRAQTMSAVAWQAASMRLELTLMVAVGTDGVGFAVSPLRVGAHKEKSLVVSHIEKNSLADRAGLQFGDVILRLGTYAPVRDARALFDEIAHALSSGQSECALSMTVHRHAVTSLLSCARESVHGFGIKLSSNAIQGVKKGTNAHRAGMTADMCIVAIDGESVVGMPSTVLQMKLCTRPYDKTTVFTVMPKAYYTKLVKMFI